MNREVHVRFVESLGAKIPGATLLEVKFPGSTHPNIYVKSKKSAERVMVSITRFIEEKLKLKVNKEKSAVDRPWKLKFLGFSFYHKKGGIGIQVHPKPVEKFKQKLKEITGRSKSMSMEQRMEKLRQCITGWANYFSMADMKTLAKTLDEWLRRRIRRFLYIQNKEMNYESSSQIKKCINKNMSKQGEI